MKPEDVQFTFRKEERLCRIRIINHLFEKGEVFYNGIFKVVWAVSPVLIPSSAQVAFSVSKKAFRRAVSRNLAKRRMREAYRLNKSKLYDHLLGINKQLVFVIILKGNEIPEYSVIEKAMISVINRLITLSAASA